jgi:hypothetical protein
MTAPSRDFLVQQSILNAIEYWKPFYSRQWLTTWDAKRPLPPLFRKRVIDEFRALASRYSDPTVAVFDAMHPAHGNEGVSS